MKVLTAATVLITLPNVVYGMYGMNIGLPLQHRAWAYPVVVGISFLLCVAVFVVGRRKRIF